VLCETGIAGVLALSWLFVRSLRRLRAAAKVDVTSRRWLLVGLAASVTGFAVGMLTYDAFSFIQVTFLMFISLGLGAAVLNVPPDQWETVPSPGRSAGSAEPSRPPDLALTGAAPDR